jgi:hypothetical protein
MKVTERAKPVIDDYWYELTDDQIRHGLSMTPLQRLTWLDEARRFSLLARQAERTYYRDGEPVETVRPVEHEE